MDKSIKAIKAFGLFILVIFGYLLFWDVAIALYIATCMMLGSDYGGTEYANLRDIISSIIIVSLFVSGVGIVGLKKWGLKLFLIAIILDLINKIHILTTTTEVCPFLILSVITVITIDSILLTFYYIIFRKEEVKALYAK